ncbi:MAG TPA: hypothetical protein PLA94_21975 [Myxococcota bacterium]|nr:hypothetical protein [Myxococcota bacterium]HND32686.1 hypothetical protein [Myxococcota bacterium]
MLDFSTDLPRLPAQKSVVIGTTGNVVEVKIDSRVGRISFQPIGADAKLSLDSGLADGEAIGSAEYSTLNADTWWYNSAQRELLSGCAQVTSYFVTAASGTRIEVFVEAS